MSSPLQTNITNLQDLLEAVNSLPEASTGGEQATPVISVNTSGLITATAGAKSSTHQLAFQPAKTITPSTASQIAVLSGYYTGGNITVASVPTQTKSVTPTSSTQNVTPDSGKFLSKVTVSGDINLVAENIKSGVSIFGVSGTLEESSGSGGLVDYSANEDAIISRSISGAYTNDRITTIGEAAFFSCTSLTTVNFPVCTSISRSAFFYCTSLTTVNFPVCTFIGYYAFGDCTRLTTVSFPACKAIDNSAFYYCTRLTTVSFPSCTRIGNDAFGGCTSLTTVSFPSCTSIGSYAFTNCTNLTSVSLPVCTSIGGNAFLSCPNLTSVNFPSCTSIGNYAFEYCVNLTSVSFPVCTSIGRSAFRYCYNLSSLTLGASSVCTLSNSGVFLSTPYAGYSASFSGTPYIYVPYSLVESYQTATNWAYFSSYFSAIDGSDSGDTSDSGDNVNLITFTIEGTSYQAEDGMTWAEWCESEHNTGGYYIDEDNYVVCDYKFVGFDLRAIDGDDVIIGGKSYVYVLV